MIEMDTGAYGGGGSGSDDSDGGSSGATTISDQVEDSERTRAPYPRKTEEGDTDESKEGEQVDVNNLLREAENIDKDGDTTTEKVEGSPSANTPPAYGGAGGSKPGEDPYEDPEPAGGWDPYDITEHSPGTAGLASGRETGSTGPDEDDDFESVIQGSDPREDVPGGPSPEGGAWHDSWGFGEGRAGDKPELPEVPSIDAPNIPSVEVNASDVFNSTIVAVVVAGITSLVGLLAFGGGDG